jgi:hypothetical protein
LVTTVTAQNGNGRGPNRGGIPSQFRASANWRDLRAQAAQAHNNRTTAYLIGTPMLADYLEEAMDAFGVSAEDFEESL